VCLPWVLWMLEVQGRRAVRQPPTPRMLLPPLPCAGGTGARLRADTQPPPHGTPRAACRPLLERVASQDGAQIVRIFGEAAQQRA